MSRLTLVAVGLMAVSASPFSDMMSFDERFYCFVQKCTVKCAKLCQSLFDKLDCEDVLTARGLVLMLKRDEYLEGSG